MTRENGKKLIAERVAEFEKNKALLTKKGHGETNIRTNYIDVLFSALGWNMTSHHEVTREKSQRDRRDGGTKKVDYAFNINGRLKFYVEAKEASVDLETNKDAAYQAKSYAYSSNGKAPIVILTDFEEFRVFNVLRAPLYDNIDRELLKSHCMKYTDYLENWDILWDAFSKEAVSAGSLDVLRGKIDKNVKLMDADFLEKISEWRKILAEELAKKNRDLNKDELNEAVQRVLDRLIFIRNLEDREIEEENLLLNKTQKAENIYASLIPVFRNFDNVYNGLLFKKHFSEDLTISDEVIRKLIKNMSYPVSPFRFDVIEPEILGRVYEKFLGSKIEIGKYHQVEIEEKLEVRKAGGVYYTPDYIVSYIVENTVGKKIEGLTPEEIKKIKIVDPACGSGSFLLGAYSYILDYHKNWYQAHKQDKAYKNDYYITDDGEFTVNLDKRGDILKNNIFGVDIDKEATEVAIMSLYLKMLDDGFDKGEKSLFFQKGHVLPDMTDNIKCGNSLIDSNYFNGKLEFDAQEIKRINPFDWPAQGTFDKDTNMWIRRGFPEVMSKGGFDCVIGNPPYSSKQSLETKELSSLFTSVEYKCDPYAYFAEQGLRILKANGVLGFIIPVTWMTNYYYMKLRKLFIDTKSLKRIILLDGLVFQDANVDTCILLLNKQNVTDNNFEWLKTSPDNLHLPVSTRQYSDVQEEERYDIVPNADNEWMKIRKKIDAVSTKLGKVSKISLGMKLRSNDEFVVSEKTEMNPDGIYFGADIARYGYCKPKYFFNFSKAVIIGGTKNAAIHRTKPKILVQAIRNLSLKRRIVASIETNGDCFIGTVNGITFSNSDYNIYYVLGLLNSTISNTYFAKRFTTISLTAAFLGEIPIRTINHCIPEEKANHDQIIKLVYQMLENQHLLSCARSDSDKALYKQTVDMIDKKIDTLVYNLYGLTDEEIRIIESGS